MNSLDMELEGKTVVMSPKYFKGDEEARKFKCEGGFGCHSHTVGSAIFGCFILDGEKCQVEGYMVEKLAEEGD